MQQDNWQATYPPIHLYQNSIKQFDQFEPVTFFDMQPRLINALSKFIKFNGLTRMMTINAPDNSIYRQLVQEACLKCGTEAPVQLESLNLNDLLGEYQAQNGKVTHVRRGLLESQQGGLFIVSANSILANPINWVAVKSAILGQSVSPVASDPRNIAMHIPSYTTQCKIIIVGDSNQLADLDYFDGDTNSGLCLFTELELEIKLSTDSINLYLGYIKWLCRRYSLPNLSASAIERLLIAGARQTEDQSFQPLGLVWFNLLLTEAAIESNGETLTEAHIDAAIEAKYERESYLPKRALEDILEGQVIIETKGEQVGQVNGLTVVDVPGHPVSYGEPARISCVIHFGDGDISDVERKAELGGNLHAKGMMIMQAFVSSALDLDEPLPYSASVVFEQSYSEVDGDSASLAELCSLVSALSGYPINQQIAVTGAVDQFGRVQAVGGLNEKIEGFYQVCRHQGFTGQQGVILPKTNLQHLSLHKDVIASVKKGEFHIWSVEHVDEVVPIIMGKPFRGDDEETVINKIAERIENFERIEQPLSFVQRIKTWLIRD
ncbi:S16 family serine protease [Vibrio maerlii]|uniref:S16 family serine protease n=1 Tax=Vibrio maerlii TaxID=2231648 RepID=UPI000E3C1F04|nr:Lon protease family protein [Vibrio maerlii]